MQILTYAWKKGIIVQKWFINGTEKKLLLLLLLMGSQITKMTMQNISGQQHPAV